MSEQLDNQAKSIQTSGGSVIEGSVTTGGDFAGRDKVTIGTFINNLFSGDSEVVRKQRNRQAMLALVRDIWIKGVLEQSLHGVAMLELGMESRPSAVEHPWDMIVQMPDQLSYRLPTGTTIAQVFDETQGSLLILGEPGSGKTTMLLELARTLIARSERDVTQPIPVVFNLSSWAEKRPPIAEWLVAELNTKYSIPKKLAQAWVEQDELLLLLDGLDEVKEVHRNDCVNALNAFRQEHLVELALCCRAEEYQGLTKQLKLAGAVRLLRLTLEQVDVYLANAGEKLATARALLMYDTVLQELAESPLTLNVMTLAYQDKPVEEIQLSGSFVSRRGHLFDAYIDRMFVRPGRSRSVLYPREQTIQWLVWLAKGMVQHTQTMFLIERLKPDWLQARTHVWLYRLSVVLSVVLIYGLIFGIGGLIYGLIFGIIDVLIIGLIVGLSIGLISGLIVGLSDIEPTERLVFSWRTDKKHLIVGLGIGLGIGLSVVLIVGLSVVLSGWIIVMRGMLIIMLIFALSVGLSVVLISKTESVQHIHPNQGIWHSVRNMWIGGLSIGLSVWLSIGLIFALAGGLSVAHFFRLSSFLGVGLSIGLLIYGGAAFIQHIALRSLLTLYNYAPLNYARFLGYCTDRIFLRKVGGGYIFVHRLLMEHFASLTEEDIKRLAGSK